MLVLGLVLTHTLLGTALPEHVWSRIEADPVARALAGQVCHQLFAAADGPLETTRQRLMFRLRLREHVRDRVPYVLHLLRPNSRDRACLPLPRGLAFLYYLIRPLRLVGLYGLRHVPRIWKHPRGC
jgi:hypothetical protein